MTQLRDMILNRRNELRAQYVEISRELKEAEAALSALDNFSKGSARLHEQAIQKRYIAPSSSVLARHPAAGSGETSSETMDQLTIKKMILSTLIPLPHGEGLTAQEIIERIKGSFGKEIERTSLSPQLSRLKGDNVIEAFDNTWYMRGRGPAQAEENSVQKEIPSTDTTGEGLFS